MSPRTSAPVSRRARPAKPPLGREVIVATAVTLLRTEGLERLTMRRLATALDTGPGSLYVYFRNAEHLYAALLDELLGEVDLSAVESEGAWEDRLAAVLASYTAVLFEYPSIARLSVFTRPSGANSLAVFEALLALLIEGRVDPAAAAWGIDLLVQYATATAAEHGTRDQQLSTADAETDMAIALDTVSLDSHPHLHDLREVLVAGAPMERFRWGIDVLVAGIAARGTAAVPRSHRATGVPRRS
jgi:AcrR family transcriptional regulator